MRAMSRTNMLAYSLGECRSHGLLQIKQGDATLSPRRFGRCRANVHRTFCTPALAFASYPFVDLSSGDTLHCKLFPDGKCSKSNRGTLRCLRAALVGAGQTSTGRFAPLHWLLPATLLWTCHLGTPCTASCSQTASFIKSLCTLMVE